MLLLFTLIICTLIENRLTKMWTKGTKHFIHYRFAWSCYLLLLHVEKVPMNSGFRYKKYSIRESCLHELLIKSINSHTSPSQWLWSGLVCLFFFFLPGLVVFFLPENASHPFMESLLMLTWFYYRSFAVSGSVVWNVHVCLFMRFPTEMWPRLQGINRFWLKAFYVNHNNNIITRKTHTQSKMVTKERCSFMVQRLGSKITSSK